MLLSEKWLKKSIKCVPIDFKKPWWKIITDQKLMALSIAGISLSFHLFWSVLPFLIAYVFESGSIAYCFALFITMFLLDVAHAFSLQLNIKFQLQCVHSIYQSAHQYLLTVDPFYHVHRSSGAILGKIDRAARGYEELLDRALFDFFPLITGLITMVVILFTYSFLIGVLVSLLFLVIMTGGYYFARYLSKPYEQEFIKSDDAFRTTAVENLAQVQFVRATFATDYMSQKLDKKIEINVHTESKLWLAYSSAICSLNLVYLLALIAVVAVLFFQIKNGATTVIAATALALAYIKNTALLLRVMSPFRKYLRGWTAVQDLFNFIPQFGKQGYPALGESSIKQLAHDNISIQANNISFDYQTAELFNHHSFRLRCSTHQNNKLYGIIGPSGSGKTTLLSILGGQLKPITGNVYINDIDIYSVPDSARRCLIGLQGQGAMTLQGTVKYNLLFGLPEENSYTDQDLLNVLKSVGLLKTLGNHKGLETMLGERGLNLSGGQRQRLNFASLFLRAQYYKPAILLIDEPTSSLDEISEEAITSMIMDLAHHSVTLVIAHRLKTVADAVGLIDLSLLQEEKEITPYSADELEKRSTYYHQLLNGKIELDS